jgi:hypothetical protein
METERFSEQAAPVAGFSWLVGIALITVIQICGKVGQLCPIILGLFAAILTGTVCYHIAQTERKKKILILMNVAIVVALVMWGLYLRHFV